MLERGAMALRADVAMRSATMNRICPASTPALKNRWAVGRNFAEVLRALDAMQQTYQVPLATSANEGVDP